MKCPIAYQLSRRADAKALSTLTYQELDQLIARLCYTLRSTPSSTIAFIPRSAPTDIALFFAAWRLGKSVFPLSFRLPRPEVEKRLKLTGATLITPIAATRTLPIDTIDPDQIATLIETASGSKIACHRLSAHLASAQAANAALHFQSETAYCLNLPLFHISGIATMLRTFVAGGHLLLKDEWRGATHISAVSTQLFRYCRDSVRFPQLKCMLIGGGPFPSSLNGAPYPIVKTYGMTEAGSMIAADGRVLPHIKLKIAKGEIWIRGPSLFSHYFGSPPQVDWFPTRNGGYFDRDKLVVTGRLDRIFISGGEKIQPETVEQALLAIPGVLEAQVRPQQDAEFGEVPAAKIVASRPLSQGEIEEWLSHKLPKYQWPKSIQQVARLDSKLMQLAGFP